jgi:hypothetical protein
VNEIGSGEFSDIVEIALVNNPARPAQPLKINSLSNSTKITVRWDKNVVPVEELPSGEVKYYKLYMDDGNRGNFTLVSHTAASLS